MRTDGRKERAMKGRDGIEGRKNRREENVRRKEGKEGRKERKEDRKEDDIQVDRKEDNK